jgi:hypothetical protein
MTTTTWDAPAQAHIQAAAPGLPRLLATLQAAAATCQAAIPLAPSPAIDPFAYPATRGVLVTLLLTLDLASPPELADLDPPPDDDTAARVVDQLLRAAADQTLDLCLELRGPLPPAAAGGGVDPTVLAVLEALAAAMGGLAGAYFETFARPW